MFILFASAYSSTPRPPSLRHIHRTFQRVRIAWVCDPIAFPGWYFVHPIQPECAPILYKTGWYVHHSDLHLVQWFALDGLPVCALPHEDALMEVRHA